MSTSCISLPQVYALFHLSYLATVAISAHESATEFKSSLK